MEYIIHKDFNEKAICGCVSIPRGTICTEKDGTIYHDDHPICLNRSENAYRHFARNNDGNGLKRGELITAIKDALALQDEHTYERWHRVWNAPICRQFNRGGDTWNWNFAFYNAEIPYLEHIHALITDENWLGIEPPTETDEKIEETEAQF
jgi:hypothetical protein